MSQLGRYIILLGIVIVLVGLILMYGKHIPGLNRLGRLPGDIIIKKENFSFYFPWVTCLLISVILFFILKLLRR